MTLRGQPDGQRHGSNDTVRGAKGRKDSEVSPNTVAAKLNNIAPWVDQPVRALSVGRGSPSTVIAPWSRGDDHPHMASSIFDGSFFNDSSDDLAQISPGFAPQDGMEYPGEDRRPSAASATTVSSNGSKSSMGGRMQKKLQSFFGEDYLPAEGGSRQNSEASSIKGGILPSAAVSGSRNRNNSLGDNMLSLRSRAPSPMSSAPRTPVPKPSNDVTPWVFQDPQTQVSFANASLGLLIG